MSAEVKAVIAEEIAKLRRLVSFPKSPFGYGSDISGAFDVDPSMAETDPNSTLGLAQSIVRRLDCPRGENPDSKDYGIGLRQTINRGITAEEVNSMGGQISGEISKDDRIDRARVVVTPSDGGRLLTIAIQVSPVDPRLGTFSLTLAATSASILIDSIRQSRQ